MLYKKNTILLGILLSMFVVLEVGFGPILRFLNFSSIPIVQLYNSSNLLYLIIIIEFMSISISIYLLNKLDFRATRKYFLRVSLFLILVVLVLTAFAIHSLNNLNFLI